MKELAREYKESLRILNQRINELTELKIKLQETSKDPEHDPDIIELNERLEPLLTMQRDAREVVAVVKNYYRKEYWRSEEYTLNSRKSRKHVYVGHS